jgi:hypothetical protein
MSMVNLGGTITLSVQCGMIDKKFSDYVVDVKGKNRGTIGNAKTLEAAKALAQYYYESGKPKPSTPMSMSLRLPRTARQSAPLVGLPGSRRAGCVTA